MNKEKYANDLVSVAKNNFYLLRKLPSALKNKILLKMADSLNEDSGYIIKENKRDVIAARKNSRPASFIDRLMLNNKRIKEMSDSLKAIAQLKDPVDKVIDGWRQENGLYIKKVRVPIGVILVIYEARPNVTSDCVGLCLKSSNIVILRGGRDAFNTNKAIYNVLVDAVKKTGVNFLPFFLVELIDRDVVDILLKKDDYIDLVIPRGGEGLIRKVVDTSRIPVIKHYKGNCHIFIDESADLDTAIRICVNAKVQRPSVCNAVETILVHKNIAKKFLPRLKKEFDRYQVEIRGCPCTSRILKGIVRAKEDDWYREYLDLIVSVKVVNNIDDAIKHINFYGSHHTDSIITENYSHAEKFVSEIDSACCFVNISTRFSDGYQFGLGAEIGISTDKLHARGPMGIEDLTTYKYIVSGKGLIRE